MLKRCIYCGRLKPSGMYASETDPWCADCGPRKMCSDCGEVKSHSLYRKTKNAGGLDKKCKDCRRAWDRDYQKARYKPRPKRKIVNKPRQDFPKPNWKVCATCGDKKSLADYYKNSSKSGLSSSCKTCTKGYAHKWTKGNKSRSNATAAKYRASKLQATPPWLSKNYLGQIEYLYAHAKECEMLTGDAYHVDHIVPLQGKDVCGLHVPWNLQVLPADLNISKKNTHNDW